MAREHEHHHGYAVGLELDVCSRYVGEARPWYGGQERKGDVYDLLEGCDCCCVHFLGWVVGGAVEKEEGRWVSGFSSGGVDVAGCEAVLWCQWTGDFFYMTFCMSGWCVCVSCTTALFFRPAALYGGVWLSGLEIRYCLYTAVQRFGQDIYEQWKMAIFHLYIPRLASVPWYAAPAGSSSGLSSSKVGAAAYPSICWGGRGASLPLPCNS